MPKSFWRIRHYGLLANRRKGELLARCREVLGSAPPPPPAKKNTAEWLLQLLGIDVTRYPQCGQPTLERTEVPPLRQAIVTREPVHKDTS